MTSKVTFLNKFLQEMEDYADGELQREDSKRCIADAKSIQSLSASKLGKRIQEFMQSFSGRGISKSNPENFVAGIKSCIPFSRFIPPDYQDISSQLLAKLLLDDYQRIYKRDKEKLLSLRRTLDRIPVAMAIKEPIKLIKEILAGKDYERNELFLLEALGYEFYIMGLLRGIIMRSDKEEDRFVQRIMHKIYTGRGVYEARHREKDQLYQEAEEDAKKRWFEGDDRYHDQMARYLCSKKKYKDLSYESLKKRLIPIAKDFNKVYDSAKVKKRKLKKDK